MILNHTAIRSFFLALVCSFLGSCAAPDLNIEAMSKDWQNFMQTDYVLQPNDQLQIWVKGEVELDQTVSVPPTGTILLRKIPGGIPAAGKPMRVFRDDVFKAYNDVFEKELIVGVTLIQAGASTIYVCGEVRGAGPRPYVTNMTLSQAIAAAGGFTYRCKLKDVRVVRTAPNGEPTTYRVNGDKIFHSNARDFLLLPGDVVYCQTNWAGDAADGLRLYLWDLFPLRGSLPGAGF